MIILEEVYMNFNIILFDNFETLDVFGPVEVIGKIRDSYNISFFSEKGGIIKSSQNVRIETLPLDALGEVDVLMIPGGQGTRVEISNDSLIHSIRELSEAAKYVLTVCTGSALLAKTGLLKGKGATTNKVAFDWVCQQDRDVAWVKKARWIKDGKFYTSSGVSAGIDMALQFIADLHGRDTAKRIACGIEYIWNEDAENDPFCI